MAHVDLRLFHQSLAGSWDPAGVSALEVHPASAVLAAALVSPRPVGARGDIGVVLSLAGLLLEHLNTGYPGPLMWRRSYWALPPFFQRFLTEAASTAITVELAETYGWDPLAGHALIWFDDLKKVAQKTLHNMLPGGEFPDVLCQTPLGWLALEARGRSARAPVTTPNAAQRGRLDELGRWSVKVGRLRGSAPKWAMGWAWLGLNAARVDFFDPGDLIVLSPPELDAIEGYLARTDRQLRESLGSLPSRTRLEVAGRNVDLALRQFETAHEASRIGYVGVASADAPIQLRNSRSLGEGMLDAVSHRGILYLAGTVDRSVRDTIDIVVEGGLRRLIGDS